MLKVCANAVLLQMTRADNVHLRVKVSLYDWSPVWLVWINWFQFIQIATFFLFDQISISRPVIRVHSLSPYSECSLTRFIGKQVRCWKQWTRILPLLGENNWKKLRDYLNDTFDSQVYPDDDQRVPWPGQPVHIPIKIQPGSRSSHALDLGDNFYPGDLVMARCQGYPWWPGMILSRHLLKGKDKKLKILFFDSEKTSKSLVSEMQVKPYTEFDEYLDRKKKLLPKSKVRSVKVIGLGQFLWNFSFHAVNWNSKIDSRFKIGSKPETITHFRAE